MEYLSYFIIILKVDNTPAYPARLPNLDGVNFFLVDELLTCDHQEVTTTTNTIKG